MLIDPGMLTDLIGILILGIGIFFQWQKSRLVKKAH